MSNQTNSSDGVVGSIVSGIIGIGVLVGGGAWGHEHFFSSKEIERLESYISSLRSTNYDLTKENETLRKRYSIQTEYYLIDSCVAKYRRNFYSQERTEKACMESLKNMENYVQPYDSGSVGKYF